MGLQLDLNKSVEENLKHIGGKRRRRGGNGEEVDEEAAKKVAEYAIVRVLKDGYELMKPAAKATGTAVKKIAVSVTEAGAAGAILYVVDKHFRSGLCDPLAYTLAKSVFIVPPAQAYATSCDNAMNIYTTAIGATALMLAPILLDAVKRAGSVFVSDETLENVKDTVVETVKNPAVAAQKAITTRSKVPVLKDSSEDAPSLPTTGFLPFSPRRRGGKSKKLAIKKRRTTRRRKTTFSY